MSDLTFAKIDLISLLNLLSVTRVFISVPDPTPALFFTFTALYHMTHIGSASCSKQFLLCVKREKTNKMQQSDVYYQLLSQHVSCIIMPIFKKKRPCVTAYGVLRWFCWMWLVAVVGRCVVGCEQFS
jgi:hypothetical protein